MGCLSSKADGIETIGLTDGGAAATRLAGVTTVQILCANGMPNMDVGSLSDCYAEVSIHDK